MRHSFKSASRISTWFVVAGIIAAWTTAAHADHCDLVRVVLNGCESVSLPPNVRVRIAGGNPVTLTRQPDGSYTGSVSPTDPDDHRKTANVLDLSRVRTACNTAPKPDPSMQSVVTCRVLYDIPCEPYWAVDVTAEDDGLSLAYACKPRPPAINACEPDITADNQAPLDPDSALTISPIAISQHLLLDLKIAGGTDVLEYDVRPAVLQRQPGQTMKLSKLPPIVRTTGVRDRNENRAALMDTKSDDAARGVTITMKSFQ